MRAVLLCALTGWPAAGEDIRVLIHPALYAENPKRWEGELTRLLARVQDLLCTEWEAAEKKPYEDCSIKLRGVGYTEFNSALVDAVNKDGRPNGNLGAAGWDSLAKTVRSRYKERALLVVRKIEVPPGTCGVRDPREAVLGCTAGFPYDNTPRITAIAVPGIDYMVGGHDALRNTTAHELSHQAGLDDRTDNKAFLMYYQQNPDVGTQLRKEDADMIGHVFGSDK